MELTETGTKLVAHAAILLGGDDPLQNAEYTRGMAELILMGEGLDGTHLDQMVDAIAAAAKPPSEPMAADLLQWHEAAVRAIEALELMRARLEVNDCEGEEEPHMEVCDAALATLNALPINREVVIEANRTRLAAADEADA